MVATNSNVTPKPCYFTCTLGQAALHKDSDNFTNINTFIEENATLHGELPAVGFCLPSAVQAETWESKVLTFRDILQGSCATASLIVDAVAIDARESVALLCPSTTAFLFTWLALMRLGHPVLLIAPQCSPIAIVELCRQCRVTNLFYDDVYKDLAGKAMEHAQSSDQCLVPHLIPFVDGPDPFNLAAKAVKPSSVSSEARRDDIAYLHHTSGTSSGTPKPIPQTHNAGAGVYARFDGSQHATFTTTPLYHGGIADLFRAWTSNALVWLFPGKEIPITAANILKCLESAKRCGAPPINYFSSVPYVLQMMASAGEGLEALQKMEIVGVGGAALPTDVGDALVNSGVNLVSRFGSAECGFLMSSHRDYPKDKEWQYLRAGEGSERLQFEPRDDGLSELVILSGWPHMSKTNRQDGSFATSDLFKPHPSLPNAWKYDSRADSQLTLVTGKKFDPAPLEDSIAAKSDLIQDVLIFGNGKPYPGALLFQSAQGEALSDQDLLNLIMPEVEKLNLQGQSHTRISKNMLIAMPFNRNPLEKSSKGTVLRSKAEQRYANEIEAAYVRGSEDVTIVSDAYVEEHVLELIRSITSSSDTTSGGVELQADTDLFAYGIDSVACIQMRHAMSKLLPQGSQKLPMTIVQDCGSVAKLSQAIIDMRHGRSSAIDQTKSDRSRMMNDLVREYSQLLDEDATHESLPPSPPRSPTNSSQRVVLLTGATGSLGSHLLSQLLNSEHVAHIHVLLRGATQQAAEERIRKALRSKRLAIPSTFDQKVSIHICSLSKPHLGLKPEIYHRLVQEVDLIYHLAWSVDFTMPLSAFRQHFAGLQTILGLSRQHKKYSRSEEVAKVVFCSSTASVALYKDASSIPESIIEDTKAAGNIGYSSSKWVAENICEKLVKQRPELDVSVVRVGQVAGDVSHGIWNTSEAYPLLLSSVKETGCLPDLPGESVAWIPVDVAAKAFVQLGTRSREEISLESAGGSAVKVYHFLSQDTSTTWAMLLQWLSKRESFETVSPQTWLAKLEHLAKEEGEKTHPSLKLLDFWKAAYGSMDAGKARQQPRTVYEMAKSRSAMPVLADDWVVGEEYFLKLWEWVKNNV